MKRTTILLALCNLLWCNVTLGGFWTITQLTDNSWGDLYPKVSGTNVVWYSQPSPGKYFLRSNFSWEYALPNDLGDSGFDLSETNVVWMESHGSGYEIYTSFDGQISDSTTSNNEHPRISGTYVVWHGKNAITGNNDIYSNFREPMGGDWTDAAPDISGTNVVWQHNAGHGWDIWSTSGPITNNDDRDDIAPAISGTNVVWRRYDGHDYEVYSTFVGQLTSNDYDDAGRGGPAVSGSNVVWDSSDEIWSYFDGLIIQIPANTTLNWYPDISGVNVVWQGWDGTDWEIYMATYVPAPGAVLLGMIGLGVAGIKLRKFA